MKHKINHVIFDDKAFKYIKLISTAMYTPKVQLIKKKLKYFV